MAESRMAEVQLLLEQEQSLSVKGPVYRVSGVEVGNEHKHTLATCMNEHDATYSMESRLRPYKSALAR